MKYLKKLWEKCGDEDFTIKVILGIITLCTVYNVTCLDNPPELNGVIVALNAIMFIVYLFKIGD